MYDPNKPETEEDAILVQERRRYRALQSLQAQPAPLPASLPSQSSTPATTESPSGVKTEKHPRYRRA